MLTNLSLWRLEKDAFLVYQGFQYIWDTLQSLVILDDPVLLIRNHQKVVKENRKRIYNQYKRYKPKLLDILF